MSYGWSGTILRIDLTNNEITREPTKNYTRKYLGGRGINHIILFREVPTRVNAFDPENLLIFGLGPLTGAFLPNSGRTQVTFKSPYPSGWGDSNGGGHWGPEVKYAGYDNIVIKGKSSKPVYLWIDDDRVEIRDASHLWGKDRFEAEEIIRQELGDEDIKIMSIGRAGENQVWFANIINDLTNSAGRTGGGAVMGSKKLKAIAVRGTKGVSVAKPKELIELSCVTWKKLTEHFMYANLSELGTPGALDIIGATGMVPVKNFNECGWWEKREPLKGESITKHFKVRKSACLGCNIHCHTLYEVKEGKYAGTKGGGPEYEAVVAFGTKCVCDDIKAILYMNALCNKYGLDCVSTGNIFALLMDLYDRGIISEKDTDGIPMVWGDAEAMIKMIEKIAYREGVGDKLAVDQLEYAKNLKRDAEKFVIHNKGLSPTGVEIRSAIGAALTFCLSPRGAHHLSGIPTIEWVPNPVAAKKICGYEEGGDPMSYHPQAKANTARYYENLFIIIDSLGLCKFPYGHSPIWHDSAEDLALMEDTICKFLKLVTGEDFTWEELFAIADRIYNIERLYINNMGMDRKDDQPCIRSQTESCPGEHPIGPVPLPPIDMDKYNMMLDAYYELRGWDKQGRPTKVTIKKLGLNEEVLK